PLGGTALTLGTVSLVAADDPDPVCLQLPCAPHHLGFGTVGFETFHFDIPDDADLRGQTVTITIASPQGVEIDNVAFESRALIFGNPDEARQDPLTHPDNYLIERPQYSLSYNKDKRGPNWVAWELDRDWRGVGRFGGFELDPDLPARLNPVDPG